MRTRISTLALLAGLLALPSATAGQSKVSALASPRAQAVAAAPKGATFRSSGQEYRVVLGVRATEVPRSAPVAPRLSAAGASGADLLEVKGPYAIYREPAGTAPVGGAETRAVAVNTRSGQLGVITGTITGWAASAAEAGNAARAAGVALEFYAESTGYGFFLAPEGGDALAAAAALRAASGLKGVQVEVRESYDEPE